MANYNRIIFVAQSGNCREPMASGILAQCELTEPVEILSRGIVVQFPEPLNQKAEAIMRSHGIKTEGFTSRQLEVEEVTEDTLVLVMESAQKKRLQKRFPQLDKDHLAVLTEYVGEELETLDPYGSPLQNYGLCYESLKGTITKLARLLNAQTQILASEKAAEEARLQTVGEKDESADNEENGLHQLG